MFCLVLNLDWLMNIINTIALGLVAFEEIYHTFVAVFNSESTFSNYLNATISQNCPK